MDKEKINKSAIEKDMEQKNIQFLERESSDLLKAIDILQNPKSLETNTILTDNMQVNALSLMNWASQVFDIEFFKQYVSLYPRYKISGDDGRGRRETIQIAEAIRREKIEEHERLLDVLGKR